MRVSLVAVLFLALLSHVVSGQLLRKLRDTLFGGGERRGGSLEPLAEGSLKEKEIEKLLKESADFIASGEMKKSVPLLLSVLESEPDHAQANMLLGTLFLEQGRLEDAEAFLYKAVIATNFDNAIAIINLMSALKQKGDPELAIEVGQSALNAGNLSSEYNSLVSEVIGNTYLFMKDFGKASNWLFFACMVNPEETAVKLWLQASTLEYPSEHRDAKVAESVLLEAMKHRAKSPEIVYYLGMATESNGNVNEAIVLYQEAIDLDREENNQTKIPDAWASLGTALHSKGKLSEAEDCYQRGYALNPENGLMLLNWAALSSQSGQQEKCRQAANEAIRILGADNRDAQAALAGCG